MVDLIFFCFSVHNWYNHGRSTNKSFSLNTVKPYMRRGALLLGTSTSKLLAWKEYRYRTVSRKVQYIRVKPENFNFNNFIV
jgi:hypothetical protein